MDVLYIGVVTFCVLYVKWLRALMDFGVVEVRMRIWRRVMHHGRTRRPQLCIVAPRCATCESLVRDVSMLHSVHS